MRNYKRTYEDKYKKKLENFSYYGRKLNENEINNLLKIRDHIVQDTFFIDDKKTKKINQLPNIIQLKIKKNFIYSICFIAFAIITFLLKLTNAWIFVPCILLSIYFIDINVRWINAFCNDNYVVFSGVVTNTKTKFSYTKKIHSALSETLVDISNGETIITIITKNKNFEVGNIVSVYMKRDVDIYQTEDGMIVSSYMFYEFNGYENEEDFNKKNNIDCDKKESEK